jgi:hypothetical protein
MELASGVVLFVYISSVRYWNDCLQVLNVFYLNQVTRVSDT